MKEKEPLPKEVAKKVVKKLASPLIAIVIGSASAFGGVADRAINDHNIDNRLEQMFPPSASSASQEELGEARKKILIFNATVHDLIISGESTIEVAKIADQPQLKKSIELVKEHNMREKQRNELREDLHSTRSTYAILGGALLIFGSMGLNTKRTVRREEERGRQGQNISPAPINT